MDAGGHARQANGVAAVAGTLFLLLSAAVALGLTRGADLAFTLWLQGFASAPLDLLANAHTYIGLVYVTVGAALLGSVILWARERRGLALAALGILATGAVELVLKLGLQHPGPPEQFVRAIDYLGPGYQTPSSFPSGHAARITFLSALVALATGSLVIRALAIALVAVTIAMRVYIGDHWVSDVLGGATLGLAIAALSLLVGRALEARLAQSAASNSSFARRK